MPATQIQDLPAWMRQTKDKTYEIMVLKTLDMRKEKTMIPWKMQNKVNQRHNRKSWNNDVVVGKEVGSHAQELENSWVQGFPPAVPKYWWTPLTTSKVVCLSLSVILIVLFSMYYRMEKLGKNMLIILISKRQLLRQVRWNNPVCIKNMPQIYVCVCVCVCVFVCVLYCA